MMKHQNAKVHCKTQFDEFRSEPAYGASVLPGTLRPVSSERRTETSV
jgi:hypothetical protein